MLKLISRFTMLTIASVLVLVTAGAQTALGPVTGDADNGKQLYYDYGCFACHGYEGIGQKNLANDVSGIMFNEVVFLTYLRARADQNPINPNSGMPNYAEESLSDDNAKDIYAYIRTFKDEPPEVTDIPALKAILEDAENQ